MTLTLRSRLAAISTIVFGVVLAALGFASYQVLARRLDADVTDRLTELTYGLHGYLHFDGETTTFAFDATGTVVLSNDHVDGYVIADAVEFVAVK